MPELIEKKKRTKAIPASLVYEEMDGRPLYRKGYQKVLTKKKSPEDIMGSSVLQSLIVSVIIRFLYQQLPKSYVVATNEAGLHLEKGDNLSNDIAVYNKKDIPNLLSRNYFEVAARLVIEVDVKIDTESFTTPNDYTFRKTTKLLDFGVPRVIWIATESRKIMVAEPGKDWIIADWHREVELMDGLRMNLEVLLKEEGVL